MSWDGDVEGTVHEKRYMVRRAEVNYSGCKMSQGVCELDASKPVTMDKTHSDAARCADSILWHRNRRCKWHRGNLLEFVPLIVRIANVSV